MSYKVIAAVGDSITNGYWDEEGLGWFGRLSQKIANTYPLKFGFNNMSQSGDRTCDTYHRVASEALTKDVDILIIACGTNDIARSPNITSQTAMSEYLRNKYWNKLLEIAQKNISKIIVLDILPSNGIFNTGDEDIHTLNQDVIEYNQIIKNICQTKNITFVSRHHNWKDRNLSNLYHDALHPNTKGHQLIADEVFNELKKLKIIG